jgi:hypothetical protein
MYGLSVCAQGSPEASPQKTPDKSGYTLFNPTPSEFMREMGPDRPDKTDSPFTVDAGHFQIEMDFANITHNEPNGKRGNVRSTAFEIAPVNLKLGLLNNLDFQLVYVTYREQKSEDLNTGTIEREGGFNGITPRLKLNLLGNDGGFVAVGLIPFVTLPLSSGRLQTSSVEGGLGIPYSFDIPGWDVGLQTTFSYKHDEDGGSYHGEIDNSISIGHRIVGNLSFSAEFFSSVSTERDSDWIGTVDAWVTFQLNRNVRLDGGIDIGVTAAADDWHPWIGMTWRY